VDMHQELPNLDRSRAGGLAYAQAQFRARITDRKGDPRGKQGWVTTPLITCSS
jgi:hypothetical protein